MSPHCFAREPRSGVRQGALASCRPSRGRLASVYLDPYFLRSRCPSQKPPATPALFTSDEFYLSLPEVSGCGPDARHSASLLALLLRIMRLMNATIPSTSKT